MQIRIALVAAALVGGLAVTTATGQEAQPATPATPPSSTALVVRFLNVGQGDGAWLTTPDGHTILIDCGPPAYGRRLVVDLQAAGVEKIDVLAPSHAHSDHIGGCTEVIRRLPVDEVLWTGQTDTSAAWKGFWSEVQQRNLPITNLTAGEVFNWGGGVTATIYNPSPHTGAISEYDDSAVVLVDYLGTRILFVGDLHGRGEQRALAAGLPQAHILKIAEHGSDEGSSAEFLHAVNPRLAILSYAVPNSFGLPNPAVLGRLNDAGIASLATADHGTVTITVDGYSVATDR